MTANRTNLTFIDARKMLHFGVLNITRARPEDIRNFIAALTDSGRKMGNNNNNNRSINYSDNKCSIDIRHGDGQ